MTDFVFLPKRTPPTTPSLPFSERTRAFVAAALLYYDRRFNEFYNAN